MRLVTNYPYVAAVVIFGIGVYTILRNSNLIKKVIGANIMSSAVFLLFLAAGNIKNGTAPIVGDTLQPMVNPLPAALILTGIVVSLSVTAFALALIVRIHKSFGTIEADQLAGGKVAGHD